MVILLLALVFFFLLISLVFLKEILAFINSISYHLRDFTHNNSGFFTVLFMFIFFVEQFLLMLVTYFVSDISTEGQLLIGIFALIVLSTAGLEKFILEKKYQYLSKEINKVTSENELMLMQLYADNEKLLRKYVEVKEKLKKER